ncbi:MAG: hypothetical protein IJU16_08230 [Clostridia bacterium]|nr:hypothetical protein [Clostridia bacterium]
MMYPDFRDLFDAAAFLAGINIIDDRKLSFERIYIGSSFCPVYFIFSDIYPKVLDYCSKRNLKISLSVPVFNEALLQQGKEKLGQLIEAGKDVIDEVIVNDIGMLRYVSEYGNVPVVLGRLFFKDPRDGRLPAFVERTAGFSLLTFPDFINQEKVIGIELDPLADVLDLRAIRDYRGVVTLNGPYCYMSVGMICKFGSVHKTVDQKFRPSTGCRFECQHIVEIHADPHRPLNKKLIRAGRAVFFYQPKVETIGRSVDRQLYFPLDEFTQRLKG